MSASWAEDDFWDVAARYADEFNGFKLAVATAYSEASDENTYLGGGRIAQGPGTDFFQVGAYVEHVPTGVFLCGAYGRLESNVGVTDGDSWTASRRVCVSVGRPLATPFSRVSTRTPRTTPRCSTCRPSRTTPQSSPAAKD